MVTSQIEPGVRLPTSIVSPAPSTTHRSALTGWSASIGIETIGRPWLSAAATVLKPA
jgi:hypothetical protein